jgi:hypothetical protein
MGRPSTLTPELQARILKLVRRGLFTTTICGLVGVGRTTLWEWVQDGEAGDAPDHLRSFALKYRRAEALAEVRYLKRMETKTSAPRGEAGDWGYERWFCERRWPKRWGSHSEENRERDELPRTKRDLPKDKARDLAKAGRLRSVGGGKR